MTYRIILPMIAAASLTACALPDKNSLNRADLRAFTADDTRAAGFDPTPSADIPTGAATYEGHIRSDAIVNGEDDFSVAGLLDLRVDMSASAARVGSGDVSGSISDINLFDDNDNGYEDQKLDGDLDISGTVREGRLGATATGVLGAVLSDTLFEQTSTWSLDLDGDFVDDAESADVITGRISGGTTGGSTDEYDILLTGSGRFLGERR
ncbi:MAG: hypothetical protein ACI9ND_003330 [Yoonia sp.]|jgi:hypothetical protein